MNMDNENDTEELNDESAELENNIPNFPMPKRFNGYMNEANNYSTNDDGEEVGFNSGNNYRRFNNTNKNYTYSEAAAKGVEEDYEIKKVFSGAIIVAAIILCILIVYFLLLK